MTILNVTETQAGEYLLHIQSEATNHTVLFTVNVRGKCGPLPGTSCIPGQRLTHLRGHQRQALRDFLTQT